METVKSVCGEQQVNPSAGRSDSCCGSVRYCPHLLKKMEQHKTQKLNQWIKICICSIAAGDESVQLYPQLLCVLDSPLAYNDSTHSKGHSQRGNYLMPPSAQLAVDSDLQSEHFLKSHVAKSLPKRGLTSHFSGLSKWSLDKILRRISIRWTSSIFQHLL